MLSEIIDFWPPETTLGFLVISWELEVKLIRFNWLNPLSASVALKYTIWCANQLAGFYIRVTLALNG